MASSSKRKSKYERQFIAERSQVMSDIVDSEKFGWSWCESTKGVVHHTAIVFYLDYEARYTVNWTPKNGVNRIRTLLETEGQLIFEDERLKDQSKIKYMPCVDEYDVLSILHSKDDQQVDNFFSMIDKLCGFKFDKYENKDHKGDADLYDIASCNCRDHVESVLLNVMQNGRLLLDMLQDIQTLRERILEKIFYKLGRCIGDVFSVAYWLFERFLDQKTRDRMMKMIVKRDAVGKGPLRYSISCG